MKRFLISLHHWVETLPDKLYPIKHEIEGKWVRGKRAYERALEEGIEIHGPGKHTYHILIYRGTWHLLGAILLMISLTVIAQRLFSTETALYVLIGLAIAALCLQEFILHPRRYGQSTRKGIFDLVTWVAPMVAFLAFFVL